MFCPSKLSVARSLFRLRMVALGTPPLIALGCGGGSATSPGPTQTTGASQEPSGAPGVGAGGHGVAPSKAVQAACELPDEPQSAPRFDFDSAALRPRGEDILEGVAECVKAGRLEGDKLVIVGFTDPRGSAEYNDALGLSRAEAAKRHLMNLGVASEQVLVESRGERAAQGTDPKGWELDRRVEIHLATEAERGD
ncbi:MAG TPA: OmpA family protein [Labilithrix sp.]|nr:OmpA family protein [Labilithrix sp.]